MKTRTILRHPRNRHRSAEAFFRNEGTPATPFFKTAKTAESIHSKRAKIVGEQAGGGRTTAAGSRAPATPIPRPGFSVRRFRVRNGRLSNPMQSGATLSFPVDLSAVSPMEANATVEVTGRSGVRCNNWEVGFLQTVNRQWLNIFYWGRRSRHGSAISRYTCSTPIRDGSPGVIWYSNSSFGHRRANACGARLPLSVSDYPTIFRLGKTGRHPQTQQPMYLRRISRGMNFVTVLVAKSGSRIIPLRHFYWYHRVDIRFRPNYLNPNANWAYAWRTNRNTRSSTRRGGGQARYFTTATRPYNQSLTQQMTWRR
jgi:hypothetical protein